MNDDRPPVDDEGGWDDDEVVVVHQRNMLDSSWCECGVPYDQCPAGQQDSDEQDN